MGSITDLINFIDDELNRRNWTKADLSRESEISQAHISRIFSGNFQPGLNFYKSIAFTFGVSIEVILKIAGEIEEDNKLNKKKEVMESKFNILSDDYQELVIEFIDLLINRKKTSN
jgi:transcriptional regulator with XRE-family HTH domain